jgi:hypothetical protein
VRTARRRYKKCGFSVVDEGVGGRDVVAAMERVGDGGLVGRRERICVEGVCGWGWTYCSDG